MSIDDTFCEYCGEKLSKYFEHICKEKEPISYSIIAEGVYGYYEKTLSEYEWLLYLGIMR